MTTNAYKFLSDETKVEISGLDVVPPSLYESIFRNLAEKHNINIEDEETKSNEVLATKLQEINDLDDATSKKVIQLDHSAKKAMQAMTDNDESLLKETLNETQALRQEIERLKGSLYKDSLTKVYNRKWLDAEVLDSDEKLIYSGTLFLIDMNYFKHINDTYGHVAGDKVLAYVANHLQKLEADIVRYGGDEFMAIFQERDIKKFSQKMHINRELLLKKKLKFHEHQFNISYSYGGIEFHSGDSFAKILEEADGLMYTDKEKIKERIQPN
jgi:diguanylate cyclase (GGDEF)-like protein